MLIVKIRISFCISSSILLSVFSPVCWGFYFMFFPALWLPWFDSLVYSSLAYLHPILLPLCTSAHMFVSLLFFVWWPPVSDWFVFFFPQILSETASCVFWIMLFLDERTLHFCPVSSCCTWVHYATWKSAASETTIWKPCNIALCFSTRKQNMHSQACVRRSEEHAVHTNWIRLICGVWAAGMGHSRLIYSYSLACQPERWWMGTQTALYKHTPVIQMHVPSRKYYQSHQQHKDSDAAGAHFIFS